MLTQYLQMLMDKLSLTTAEAEAAMNTIVTEADPHQIAAFLAVLKYRGETVEEIAGMVEALQKRAVPANIAGPVMDIVGTGGDLAKTVNISTGSAILAAACGVPIAKHGNRSVSSRSGSADVLEVFGIDIEATPEQLEHYLREVGIAFMFAPVYHPAFKKVSQVRKGLKVPTIMNMLGPLLNPAKAEYALIGVASKSMLELNQVVLHLGQTKRTLVFHGSGLDELTTLGKTCAYDIQNGQSTFMEIDPSHYGFSACKLTDLQGGDAQTNGSILKAAFAGEPGAVADALILNAGAAVWIFGLTPSLADGIQVARKTLREGGALRVLEKWIALSKQLKSERHHEQG